jgi:restriction system protein
VDPISPELAAWLDAIQADDAPETPLQEDVEYEDDEPSSFDGPGQRLIWSFPTDALYEEYLAALEGRSEEEVRTVIRRLLIPPNATVGDHLVFEAYIAEHDKKNKTDEEERLWQQWANSDYVQRVVRYYGGISSNLPWEGITWIANLLPDHARLALRATEAYFIANMHAMRDGMMHAISDVEGIIRARYIGFPQSSGDRLQVLRDISPREFEQLVEHLYDSKGYQTELTPPAGDGGRDQCR